MVYNVPLLHTTLLALKHRAHSRHGLLHVGHHVRHGGPHAEALVHDDGIDLVWRIGVLFHTTKLTSLRSEHRSQAIPSSLAIGAHRVMEPKIQRALLQVVIDQESSRWYASLGEL